MNRHESRCLLGFALSFSTWSPRHFMNAVEFQLPSVANLREHPMAKAKRAKAQRMMGRVLVGNFDSYRNEPIMVDDKWLFILTRCAPKSLDSDNLASCFKSVRDGIADRLKFDDRNPNILWHYEQLKQKNPQVLFEMWKL